MRSHYLKREVRVRVEDQALSERRSQFVDGLMPASTHITPSVHKKRATVLNRVRWNLSWFLVAVVDYTVSRRLNLGL